MLAVTFDGLDVDADELARLAALLDADETRRAAGFRFDRDRRRFIARRGRLRERLGRLVGQRPDRLRFAAGACGKPRLARRDAPHFSLSHSHGTMMLAIADRAVGCDLEWIDPAFDWPQVAARLFAPGEAAALATRAPAAGRRAFFDCWARKEAFVKGLGQGLSYPLDAFEVSLGKEARLLAGPRGWRFHTGFARDGFACALVLARD